MPQCPGIFRLGRFSGTHLAVQEVEAYGITNSVHKWQRMVSDGFWAGDHDVLFLTLLPEILNLVY